MANPNFPSDGQGERIDALITTGGVVMMKYGLFVQTATGATTQIASHGVATHTDGATAGGADGVMVAAGENAGVVKHLLTDINGSLYVNASPYISILASAARTTTQTGGDQINFSGWKGIAVILDVTTPGTGSITVEIDGKDTNSGKYIALLTGAAVTTTVTNIYRIYPTLTAAANSIAQDVLWGTWRVKVTANNANTITYSVGAYLLP